MLGRDNGIKDCVFSKFNCRMKILLQLHLSFASLFYILYYLAITLFISSQLTSVKAAQSPHLFVLDFVCLSYALVSLTITLLFSSLFQF